MLESFSPGDNNNALYLLLLYLLPNIYLPGTAEILSVN